MAQKQDKNQVAKQLADTLRNTVDTAQAKVDVGGGELVWLDYARGKDLARHLKAKPELLEQLVRPAGPDRTIDDVIGDAVTQLLQRKLLAACERKYKKPKPGRTKLVKWPRTLVDLRDQSWREDAFYAWRYDKPTSAWFYVMSALVVVGVLLVTLFPLAPHSVRLAVLYALTGLLIALLGTILVRYLVFGVVWVSTGASLWILPNLMSESLPITEIFTPAFSFEPQPPGSKQYVARAVTLALLVGAGFALHRTAPDAESLGKNVKDASTSLLEYLDMMASKGQLAGNTTANATANATKGAGAKARSSGGSTGGGGAATGEQRERKARERKPQASQDGKRRARGSDEL